jgi:hypothetical protein
MGKPTVVVLGAGGPQASGLIRGLGRSATELRLDPAWDFAGVVLEGPPSSQFSPATGLQGISAMARLLRTCPYLMAGLIRSPLRCHSRTELRFP